MLFLEKLEQKKVYICLVILICMLIGILYAVIFMPENFTSSTSAMLINIHTNGEKIENNGNVELTNNLISTLEELIKSDSNIEEIQKNVDINSQISKKNILVKRISDSDTFQIRVNTSNQDDSLKINSEITKLFSNKIKSMYKDTELYIVDSSHIVSSSKTLAIVLCGAVSVFIGLLIDLIYIMILIHFEKNIKNNKDLESNLSLKTIASIPFKKESTVKLIESENEKTLTNKAFKQLRSNIQFLNVNNKSKNIILITSASDKEGKSYVSANLAVSYANVGKKVILIDADLISGIQSNIFNIPNEIGLSNFLSNLDSTGIEINERINSFIKESNIKNLNIITSGTVPPNSSELLSASKFPEMLKDLSVFYDVIILDGPKVLNEVDSLILSRQVTSIGIVAIEKQTKKDDLWKTKRDIQNVGGKIIGVILNKVKSVEKEEKTSHKILENLKEKVKKYIIKLKENRKQKLLDESKEENFEIEILEEMSEITTNKEYIEVNDEISNTKIEENIEESQTDNTIIEEESNEINQNDNEQSSELDTNINETAEEQDIILLEETDLKEVKEDVVVENSTTNNEEKLQNEKIEKVKNLINKWILVIKKSTKRNIKKCKIKTAKMYKKISVSKQEKAKQNKDNSDKISVQSEGNNKIKEESLKRKSENVVLVIVDAHNELCRAFSKKCYTEKLVRGLDTSDGFIKAQYSSYLIKKRMEALMLMYSLTKKQANRIDPMIYTTLNDYDERVWLEEKMTSNKAESYVFCMAKDYPRNEGESRKKYIQRCKEQRKEELYDADIEIEYNIDLLWKTSKMKFSDKVAMNKYAKIYGTEKNEKDFAEDDYTSNYSEEDFISEKTNTNNFNKTQKYLRKVKGLNPIKKLEVEQVKVKSVEEISQEVENELNAKKSEIPLNSRFSEIVIDDQNNMFDSELQKQEKRKEAEILKKIQREKIAKRKKEERAKKQKEREEKNRQREEMRKAKELEREKKMEEARIEEELLGDNLYPKTKNNKDL